MPTLPKPRRTTLQPSISAELPDKQDRPSPSSSNLDPQLPHPHQQQLQQHQQQQQHASSNTIHSMDSQFEPLDIIGTGSFGIIRKVKRISDGFILARKELNYGRMDERDLRQLGEEVNILQNLRGNEHIVKYFERYVDKQNFMLYILMEYCSQGDLAGVISRCRRDQVHLSEDTIWSYLAQITTALADCHSAELASEDGGKKKPIILHRDIKPENVFLNHFGLVKLGDFGLSKAMEMAAFTNTYVGTPYYMSPELINGQQYDVKSDIWALGCLIYELCAWHPPFHQAQTQPELAKLIREGKIPNLPRGYSSQLTALIKSMLRQDPKLRPDAKSILMVEQVKHQTRVLEVHRYARELTKKQTELEEREKLLEDRESLLKVREAKLQKEKEYFKAQQENHVALQEEFAAKFEHAMGVIERASQLEREMDQNVPGIDELALGEESDDELASASANAKANAGASAPRRLPLAERQLSLNNSQALVAGSAPSPSLAHAHAHPKRISIHNHEISSPANLTVGYGSPMKLDTPFKHLAGPAPAPATDVHPVPIVNKPLRTVKTSKSLASLKTTYNFLARIKTGEETDSPTAGSEESGGGLRRDKMLAAPGGGTGGRRMSRRSESANGLLLCPAPGRRPASAVGSASTPGGSTSSTNSSEPLLDGRGGSMERLQAPSAPPSTTQRSPRYNYADPDSLPSPFLKKKASASTLVAHFLRPSAAAAPTSPRKPAAPSRTSSADTIGSGGAGMKRIPSMLQHIRAHHGGAPPVAARPSQAGAAAGTVKRSGAGSASSKPSLTSRFLSGGGGRDENQSGGTRKGAASASGAQQAQTVGSHLGVVGHHHAGQGGGGMKRRESSNGVVG